MFGRPREPEEMSGVFKDICLARAADPELHDVGQDGGLVSAMLVYALEHDIIDAALVSYLEGDGSTWKAIPGIARTRSDVVASAGSRYTYSANPMAYAVYVVIAIWGFVIGSGDSILTIAPVNTADNLLHLVLGALGIAAAVATAPSSRTAP